MRYNLLTAKQIDSRIEGYAYDCTIGAGIGADDQDAPKYDNAVELSRVLGRPVPNDDVVVLNECWRKNQQMMEQP